MVAPIFFLLSFSWIQSSCKHNIFLVNTTKKSTLFLSFLKRAQFEQLHLHISQFKVRVEFSIVFKFRIRNLYAHDVIFTKRLIGYGASKQGRNLSIQSNAYRLDASAGLEIDTGRPSNSIKIATIPEHKFKTTTTTIIL